MLKYWINVTPHFEELKLELIRVCGYPSAINDRFRFRIEKIVAPGNTTFKDSYRLMINYYGFHKQKEQMVRLKMTHPIKDNIHEIAMKNVPKMKHAMKYCLQRDFFIAEEFPELVL